MISKEVKDSLIECLQKNGLKYSLQVYSYICSPTYIRKTYKALQNYSPLAYPHVYSIEQLRKEYQKIQSLPGDYSMIWNRNINIHHFQPHFFEKEMQLLSDSVIHSKLLLNRKRYLFKEDINMKEMIRGVKISGLHNGYSHFSPLIIKKFIEDTKCESIYDPCGGWGHRLLGSGSIPYIYNDIWDKSVDGVKSMIRTHSIPNKNVYNNDCTVFTPPHEYDAVFTCPPYNNKEIYGAEEFVDNGYEQFMRDMINVSFTNKLSAKIIGIVICHDHIGLVKDMYISQNIAIKEIIQLKKSRNHFERNTKSVKSNEYLVIGNR